MPHGVVVGRILAHAHERGGLLDVQVLGVLIEIDLRSHLDTHSIVEEVKLVEVHLDNLVLGVIALKLDGDDPLDGLLKGALKDVVRLRRIELLGELLGDGTATTGTLLAHDDALDDGTSDGPQIHTRMIIETRVLGSNQGICQVGRHLVKVHIDAVAATAVISSHLHAVGAIDGRCKLVGGVLQLVNGRHIADHAIVNQHEHRHQQCHDYGKARPHRAHDVAALVLFLSISFSVHILVYLFFINPLLFNPLNESNRSNNSLQSANILIRLQNLDIRPQFF